MQPLNEPCSALDLISRYANFSANTIVNYPHAPGVPCSPNSALAALTSPHAYSMMDFTSEQMQGFQTGTATYGSSPSLAEQLAVLQNQQLMANYQSQPNVLAEQLLPLLNLQNLLGPNSGLSQDEANELLAFKAGLRGGPTNPALNCPGPSTNPLYKTELCRSWEETGTCRYGGKCQFAHGREELRPVQRHPKYKTELCRTFATTGTCPYGTRCRFIHSNSPSALLQLANGGGSGGGSAGSTPRSGLVFSEDQQQQQQQQHQYAVGRGGVAATHGFNSSLEALAAAMMNINGGSENYSNAAAVGYKALAKEKSVEELLALENGQGDFHTFNKGSVSKPPSPSLVDGKTSPDGDGAVSPGVSPAALLALSLLQHQQQQQQQSEGLTGTTTVQTSRVGNHLTTAPFSCVSAAPYGPPAGLPAILAPTGNGNGYSAATPVAHLSPTHTPRHTPNAAGNGHIGESMSANNVYDLMNVNNNVNNGLRTPPSVRRVPSEGAISTEAMTPTRRLPIFSKIVEDEVKDQEAA